jgi:hypothetical protein
MKGEGDLLMRVTFDIFMLFFLVHLLCEVTTCPIVALCHLGGCTIGGGSSC